MFDLSQSISDYQDRLIVKTDPRVKLILLILCIIGVLSFRHIPQILLILSLLFILIWISKMPYRPIIKTLAKIYPIILAVSLLQVISNVGGDQSYSAITGWRLENINWHNLFAVQLKSVTILSSGLVFITSTPYPLLLKSLKKMHVPEPAIAFMFFLYRFLYTLSHELNRVYLAFQSRYIKLPLKTRLEVYVNLISTYFMRVFDRNEHLYKALISRGFQGKVLCNHVLDWHHSDTMILFSGISILILVLVLV